MDNLSFINISKEQQALFIPPIDAFEMSVEKFKKKYKAQRIKHLNIVKICHTFEENISEFIKIKYCRHIAPKIISGCETILYIRSEYINNELKNIIERFTLTFASRKEKRPPNPDSKGKRRKIKVKEEDDDDSVLFLSQEIDFDIKKELKVDENVKDKNLIPEIKEPEEDSNITAANYFGPASRDEIRFMWDNVDEIPDLNKSKTEARGKYGVFARAEKQVLESLEHPTEPGALNNEEGNFDDFPQRLSEALPKIPDTPSKRKQRDQYAAETPSKRRRPENGTSRDAEALPDDVINDEGNFADFTHRMGEALPEIPLTPSKRKSINGGDLIETPSKRSRRSLSKQLQEVKEEPSDDAWILLAIEDFDDVRKKSKKKKKKPYLDKETTIKPSQNVYIKTVPRETRQIKPSQIVTPVEVLFQMPLSLFAGNRKFKPISRLLLERFQYVASHPPPPIKEDDKKFDKNTSDLQFLPPIENSNSQIRAPPSLDNLGITNIKADPGEDLPPIEETRNDPQQITGSAVLDSKIEADEFPIENFEMNVNMVRRPRDITDTVDPALPTLDSLAQNVDTVPIAELEDDVFDNDDSNWNEQYVYRRIRQLCEGGVKITFGDLAPCAETKKMNRILAFEYILKLGADEKICLDQCDETEIITIWISDE